MQERKEDRFMEKPIEEAEADGEASRGFWLGGEAVVRRYPRKRDINFRLTRSITGLVGLALALGCAGGLWLGYSLGAKKIRRSPG